MNSTETCCYQAKVEERCKGVKLPSIVNVPDGLLPLPSSTPSTPPTSGGGGSKGLSGGVIAGIVIGAIIAVALIAFLILYWRRRRQMQASENYLNRPTVHRPSPDRNMTYANSPISHSNPQSPIDGPGGRIARMSALESRNASRNALAAESSVPLALQERPSHRVIRSTSGDFRPSDSSDTRRSVKYGTDIRPHPAPRDRNASLSSTSVLVSERHGSDSEKEEGSQLVGSPVSEQLPYFKVLKFLHFHGSSLIFCDRTTILKMTFIRMIKSLSYGLIAHGLQMNSS